MNNPVILFLYNVPSHLCLSENPDIFVTVKSELLEDGNAVHHFIDLDTLLVTRVKDWLKVWALVDKLCEKKWNEYLFLNTPLTSNEHYSASFSNTLS